MTVQPPVRLDDPTRTTWLLETVSAAYNADTVDEALKTVVDLVCTITGWPLGHAVQLGPDGSAKSAGYWYDTDSSRHASFVEATRAFDGKPAEGFRQDVLLKGQPQWLPDCRREPGFLRAHVAKEVGLGAAMIVPLPTQRRSEAILEFFAAEAQEPDEGLLLLVFHIAAQLGVRMDNARVQRSLSRSEERLQEAQNLAGLGAWTWEVGSEAAQWSPRMYAMHGLDPADGPVTFAAYFEIVHPDHRAQIRNAVRQALSSLTPYEHHYRVVLPTGAVRWMHARGGVIEQSGGVASKLGGYVQDISEQRDLLAGQQLAQRELTNHHRILEKIARGDALPGTLDRVCADIEHAFPGARCTVLLTDSEKQVLRVAAAPSLPREFTDSLEGLPVLAGDSACGTAVALNQTTFVHDALDDPLTAGFHDLVAAFDLRSVWSQPLASASGEVLGAFAVYRSFPHTPHEAEVVSVTAAASLAALAIERDRNERALTRAASIDALTGLPNRRRFLEQLETCLADREARVAVMFLDLDRFNWINDSLGHDAGDRALAEVASRLQSAVGARGVVARFGGDEFTVLVTDASTEQVEALADNVERAFLQPFLLEAGEFFLSISIGIAVNDYALVAADLVRNADSAMYAAKESGRARRARYDEGMRARSVARVALENELRRALSNDELLLHYQPIYDLRTGAVTDVEALVRWRHPSRGLLSPADFIPLAEETGLIVPLGLVVFDKAIAGAAQWASRGMGMRVTVNVSAVQLADPKFPAAVEAALVRHGLPATHVLIEVTESAVMQSIDTARVALDRLVGLGIRVLIDDFGTGYSSIARLGDLPVVGLKVDKGFTAALGSSLAANGVFSSIIGLAHAVGLYVVVEGIERPELLDRVKAFGCGFGQGYHLARPMALDQLLTACEP